VQTLPAGYNVHVKSCKEGTLKSTYQEMEAIWATLLEEDDDRLEAVDDKSDSRLLDGAGADHTPLPSKACKSETDLLSANCLQGEADQTKAVEYEEVRLFSTLYLNVTGVLNLAPD
jgi:hypothetical protein